MDRVRSGVSVPFPFAVLALFFSEDAATSGITTSEEGAYVLKRVPDEWRLYAISG
jgi:hypothetical protein